MRKKREEKQIITEVILWQNGLVMVFDQNGEQIVKYQGWKKDVEEKINKDFTGKWMYGDWSRGILQDTPISE